MVGVAIATDEKPPLRPCAPNIKALKMEPAELSGHVSDGRVLVEYTIELRGHTVDAEIIESSNQRLNEPMLEAVRSWRFVPPAQACRRRTTITIRVEDERMHNKRIESARGARPTRKGDAPLLAAHLRRSALSDLTDRIYGNESIDPIRPCCRGNVDCASTFAADESERPVGIMRILSSLLLLVLCGCSTQQAVTPEPYNAPRTAEPSVEQISAQPDITCEANANARSEVRVRHVAVEAFPKNTPG
jgi:TonB family protein